MPRFPYTVFASLLMAGASLFTTTARADAGDQAEAAAVRKASITPTRAVRIAERSGGRAYAFGMESTAHGNWYEIEVLHDGAALEIRIDPDSGKVLGTGKAHGADAAGAHSLDRSTLTLAAAIAQAERVGNGIAMEASCAGSGDDVHVTVDVVRGTRIVHYRVSMSGGQIHAVKAVQGAG